MIVLMLGNAKPAYEVLGAATADAAADIISQEKFDLYVLEYILPGISGIELCRRIRQTDSETPILFFSGMARPVDRAAAMAAGATEYLVKPNDLDNLVETMARLLKENPSISKPVAALRSKSSYGIY